MARRVSWTHINKLKEHLEVLHPGCVKFYQNGGELDFRRGTYKNLWTLIVTGTTLSFEAVQPK